MMKGRKQASESFVAVRKGGKSGPPVGWTDSYPPGLTPAAYARRPIKRIGTPDELRVFRRFPITAHKPGGW